MGHAVTPDGPAPALILPARPPTWRTQEKEIEPPPERKSRTVNYSIK